MIIQITDNEAILLQMIKVEAKKMVAGVIFRPSYGFEHDLQYGVLEVIDKILHNHKVLTTLNQAVVKEESQ